MAKTYVANGIAREVQRSEATAAKRIVLFAHTTGKTIASIDVSKAGGAFADGTSTCAEILDKATAPSGIYALALSAADVDTLGPLGVEMTAGTDEIYLEGVRVVSYDPYDDVADILADTGTQGVKIRDGAITAGKVASAALTAAKFATDFLTADGLAASAVSEIAAAIPGGTPNPVYLFKVERNEETAANRALYFYAGGTLPAKASISTNGGAFANSTAAPATVNGSWRKLVLTKAEVAKEGRLLINITTTGTVYTVTLVVDVVKRDELNPMRDALRAARK